MSRKSTRQRRKGNKPSTGKNVTMLEFSESTSRWYVWASNFTVAAGLGFLNLKLFSETPVTGRANLWLGYILEKDLLIPPAEVGVLGDLLGEDAEARVTALCREFCAKGMHRDDSIPQRVLQRRPGAR